MSTQPLTAHVGRHTSVADWRSTVNKRMQAAADRQIQTFLQDLLDQLAESGVQRVRFTQAVPFWVALTKHMRKLIAMLPHADSVTCMSSLRYMPVYLMRMAGHIFHKCAALTLHVSLQQKLTCQWWFKWLFQRQPPRLPCCKQIQDCAVGMHIDNFVHTSSW